MTITLQRSSIDKQDNLRKGVLAGLHNCRNGFVDKGHICSGDKKTEGASFLPHEFKLAEVDDRGLASEYCLKTVAPDIVTLRLHLHISASEPVFYIFR